MTNSKYHIRCSNCDRATTGPETNWQLLSAQPTLVYSCSDACEKAIKVRDALDPTDGFTAHIRELQKAELERSGHGLKPCPHTCHNCKCIVTTNALHIVIDPHFYCSEECEKADKVRETLEPLNKYRVTLKCRNAKEGLQGYQATVSAIGHGEAGRFAAEQIALNTPYDSSQIEVLDIVPV